MTPDDMIERYAYAVAARLPHSMRADVRAELSALLHEDTQAVAGDGSPTLQQVEERIKSFGSPQEVALRYYRPSPIIEAVDTPLFSKLALGLVLGLTVLALSIGLSTPEARGPQLEEGLKDAIFLVLGVLLAWFWALGALRRSQPKLFVWKPAKLPPVRDPDLVSRPLAVSALLAGSAGLIILVDPIAFFDLALGGQSPSLLAKAFTYDHQFLAERAPLLWSVLTFSLLILAFATIEGRWRPITRKLALGSSLVIALISLWVVMAGPIFVEAPTDQSMKFWVALIAGITCVDVWLKWREQRQGGGPVHNMPR
jgi:hypothetical protein